MSALGQKKNTFSKLATGLVIAAVVCTAAAGFAALALSGMRPVHDTMVQEPLTLSDIARQNVPDGSDAAPVYGLIFRDFSSSQVKADLRTATTFMSGRFASPDKKLWDRAEQAVARSGKIISLAQRAAARPECHFPVRWEEGASAVFPHLDHIRRLGCLLSMTAVVNARRGKTDEAMRNLKLAFAAAESLKDEPSLVSQVTRMAMVETASRALYQSLAYMDADTDQTKALFDQLGDINLRKGFVRAIEGERALGLWMFEQAKKESGVTSAKDDSLRRPGLKNAGSRLVSRVNGSALEADRKLYLKCMAEQVDAAYFSYREARQKGAYRDKGSLPAYAVVSETLLRSYESEAEARDQAMTALEGSRILLALHAYRKRHGSYPGTLRSLEAELGWRLPRDPFSGKDFVYKPRKRGFSLSSQGPEAVPGSNIAAWRVTG